METLRKGSRGSLVEKWQLFLIGMDVYSDEVNGIFDENTMIATKQYQAQYFLSVDGVVGPNTWAMAIDHGFNISEKPISPTEVKQILSWERESYFGKIEFRASPIPGNAENIIITNNWVKDNIVKVDIPYLKYIPGGPRDGKIFWHKSYVNNIVKLFERLKEDKLDNKIVSWGGSWAPRFIRGSRTTLSNHSWAVAFDINVAWNGLGKVPAPIGKYGSVIEIVPYATECGFFWGGNFNIRPDGMHFEIGKS